uniref:Histone deacetylase 14 n=1 Tax=Tanacetum cinerariifolium TaxID=118510 RepID=A0A6L2KWH1_TANCI|nr:hypothetical protein [Tanacetum cinerariifolium]
MADENVLAPAPIRSDDQILPFAAWVPIGKRNFMLDLQKNPTKKGRKNKPHVILYCRFMELIICHLGRIHNIHQRSTSLFHLAEEDLRLGNLKFVPEGKKDEVFGMPIPNYLISKNIINESYYSAYMEMVAKHNRRITAEKEGKKKPTTAKQPKKSSIQLIDEEEPSQPEPELEPKHHGEGDEYERAIQMSLESFQAQSQAHVGDIDEDQGKDVDNQVNLEEKTAELDQGQAKSDLGKTPESRPLPEHEFMEEDQARPDPGVSHVALAGPNPEPTEPLCSSGTLSSMKNLDDAYTSGDQFLNDNSTEDEPATTTPTTTTLPLPPPSLQQSTSDSELAVHVAALEQKLTAFEQNSKTLDNTTQNIGSRLLRHFWIGQTGTSSSLKRQVTKRHHDDQEPPPPLLDNVNVSDSEDTDTAHLPKLKTRPDWMKPVLEEDRPATPKPYWVIPPNELSELENNLANFHMEKCHRMLTDQVDLVNPEGHRIMPDTRKPLPLKSPPGQVTIQSQYFFNKDLEYLVSGDKGGRSAFSISKLKVTHYLTFGLEELVMSLWIENEREYDISVAYDIVLRRADYKEYKISEADFKNLHLNDFEDLYLLHLQGQLNHLSRDDKVHLFNAMHLTFCSKKTTIVSKPRAVIYRDRNNQKKMMRETGVHKFNDGTLNRILEKLDHIVKDFKLFKYNPGMTKRIWSEDDKRRSKEFMEVIKLILKL